MAEQVTHDVVEQAQSMGASSIGVSESTPIFHSAAEAEGRGSEPTETSKLPNGSVIENANSSSDNEGQTINGEPITNAGSADDPNSLRTFEADPANNSDTDHSRTDAADQSREPVEWRQRSNSTIKRQGSFKPVAVTKNFLSKSSSTATATTKITVEKAPTPPIVSTTPSARPRLVAKTVRDTRLVNRSPGFGSSGAPDASKVWNRNRPAPPPPPKQFTDEELKQQYGIHLATRLQADETGKESKWADIDDDEDDWAPETVEWMDGTKSTILPTQAQGTAASPAVAEIEDSKESANSGVESNEGKDATAFPGKTILRPGARLTSTAKPGLLLKSVPETYSAPEVSAPSGSSKSPWAPLPPVDKASPINFVPSKGVAQASVAAQQESSEEAVPTAPLPPTEIAADSFSRSWRDGERSTGQLFNSQSGRIEPVKSYRRNSRQEGGFRAPAVLQRPNDRVGLAGNSDLTSGPPPPPPESDNHSTFIQPPPPQDSKSPIERPSSGVVHIGRALDQPPTRYAVRRGSGMDGVPGPQDPEQDARTVQQKVMRDRIEANRKRKQEEEAAEEAAKKERIRLKMQAFGLDQPPNEHLKDDDAQAETSVMSHSAQQSSEKSPFDLLKTDTDMTDQLESDNTPLTEERASKDPSLAEPLSSPTPDPLKPSFNFAGTASPQVQSQSQLHQISERLPSEFQLPGLGQFPPQEQSQLQPWKSVPVHMDPAASWRGVPGSSGNVWAPMHNDRSLGNGTFHHDLHRAAIPQYMPHHIEYSGSPSPNPIRPSSFSPRIPADSVGQSPSPQFAHPMNNMTYVRPENIPPFTRSPMPSSFETDDPSQFQSFNSGHPAINAWRSYPSRAAQEDAEARNQILREDALRHERSGVRQDQEPIIRETFKQTLATDNLGQRQVISVTRTTHGLQDEVTAHMSGATLAGAFGSGYQGNGRPSRFFAPGFDRSQPVVVVADADRERSPPPPETIETHPAFERKPGRSLVHLPGPPPKVKLPPSPAATVSSPVFEQTVPSHGPIRVPSGSQPIVNSANWQERINLLFKGPGATRPQVSRASIPDEMNRKLREPVKAVAASSIISFDVAAAAAADATTVSLPRPDTPVLKAMKNTLPEDRLESREELVWDEPEMGSSPTVKILLTLHPNPEVLRSRTPQTFPDFKRAELRHDFTTTGPGPAFFFPAFEYLVKLGRDVRVNIALPGHRKLPPQWFKVDAPVKGQVQHDRNRGSSIRNRVTSGKRPAITTETDGKQLQENMSKLHEQDDKVKSHRISNRNHRESSGSYLGTTAEKEEGKNTSRSSKWPKPPKDRNPPPINPSRI